MRAVEAEVRLESIKFSHVHFGIVCQDPCSGIIFIVQALVKAKIPELDSLEQQVIAFFNHKGIYVNSNDIEASHPLPRKNKSEKPAIIIHFANRKQENTLLRQGRKLKGAHV